MDNVTHVDFANRLIGVVAKPLGREYLPTEEEMKAELRGDLKPKRIRKKTERETCAGLSFYKRLNQPCGIMRDRSENSERK